MTALCIDLGGSNLRAGLRSGDGIIPEPIGHWPAPVSFEAFRSRVEQLLRDSPAGHLGIAVPGLVSATRCIWVPNLPFLDGVDLTTVFPGARIALGNDAHFALLAEAADGAASNCKDAILLAIGTGIGSAVMSDGRIVRGASGAATSFGWACADPADPGDAKHGWLERMASGTALDKIARSHGLADGSALVARAREGDAEALKCLGPPAAALGTALAGAVALLGSRAVILSGGVAEGIDVFGPLLLPALRRQLPPHLRDVELTKGAFGARAALVGAGLAARGHPLWPEDTK